MTILHLVVRDVWDAVEGAYAPPSLTAEGFVHCSTPEQVDRVAAERFAGDDDLLVLTIDPSRTSAELRWEDSHGDGRRFPHLYGPIDLTAVVGVAPFAPGRAAPAR